MRERANNETEDFKLLWNVTKSENNGDLVKSKIDFDFFRRCLNVQKSASLSTNLYRRNGARKGIYLDAMEDMIDLALQEYHEQGISIMPTVYIDAKEFDYAIWNFTFKYIKQKGKNGKIRKHTDTMSIIAKDIETAEIVLKGKVRKLNEVLIEILEIDKIISTIVTKDGVWHNADNVELLKSTN